MNDEKDFAHCEPSLDPGWETPAIFVWSGFKRQGETSGFLYSIAACHLYIGGDHLDHTYCIPAVVNL